MKLFLHLISLSLALSAALISAFVFLFNLTPKPFILPQVLGTSNILEPQFVPTPIIDTSLKTSDARPLIIKNYLSKYKSELEPFYQNIVDVSDKYSLDFRLLVAIAQQESNLCKKIPTNSHNCWGFGIYGDKVTRFDSYPQAFEKVASTLKKDYVDKGLISPQEIMGKYTPPSQGSWAAGVSQFLSDLE